jgi:hypothetical protein
MKDLLLAFSRPTGVSGIQKIRLISAFTQPGLA